MADKKHWLSDDKQKDPKSREYAEEMGITRHERQHFPMSMRLPDVADDEVIIERLVHRLEGKAPGSFAATIYKDRTVKVTNNLQSFGWLVRRRGKILREGFATLDPGLGVVIFERSTAFERSADDAS